MHGKPRDIIIVKFLSYQDRALVFNNKNIKSCNANPSTRSRIFINEAPIRPRSQLVFKPHKLAAEKRVDINSRIIVRTNNKERITLINDADFNQLLMSLNVNHPPLQSNETRASMNIYIMTLVT